MRSKKWIYKFISNLALSSDLPFPKRPTQALFARHEISSRTPRGERLRDESKERLQALEATM